MRLAVLVTAAHGGLLHYASQFADALADRGHDVDLLTARDNELLERSGSARMRAVLTPLTRQAVEVPTGWRYVVRRSGIAVRLVRTTARAMWELRRGRYDAVLLYDDPDTVPVAGAVLLYTLTPGRPALAAVCHEPRPRTRWGGDDLYSTSGALLALLRRAYRRLDLVLVHGERSRAEFEATWGPGPIAVIPLGNERILAETLRPPATEERVLFFGDWLRAKGLHELMAAFDLLAERRPDARLTIAGTPSPDSDPERIRTWAAARSSRVELMDGYVPVEEVPAVFARARVVATPYLAGSQSGVVLLAMTMGRAVVASDIGELGEAVVDGETGLLVPPGDVEALAAALEKVVSDPALAERLGARGRRRVLEEFGWERVAERVEAALETIPGVPG